MSFDSTVKHAVSVIAAVPGVENVSEEPLTSTRRATNEAERGIAPGARLQAWEVLASPFEAHEGASGYQRTRARFRIRGWWFHAAGDPASLPAFRAKTAEVLAALQNPTTGFPQIAAPGISVLVEPDAPRKAPTGQSAWYVEAGFETLDCEHT